jgi:hypothetical protein
MNSGPVQVGVYISTWNIHQSNLTPSAFILVPGTFIVSTSIPTPYFNNAAVEFPFVLANNGAILTLDCIISARSHRSNGHGIISWEVNSCNEVSSFVVERSLNGGAYLSIGTVLPGLALAYQFIDPSPGRGLNAYRIRVNGVTGDHKFSNIVTVFNDTRGISVTLAPNPVKDECKITIYSALAGTAEFRVLNAAGQLVRQWNNAIVAGTTEYRLNLSGLSRGIYSLHVKSSAGELLKQIIKE